MPSAATRRFGLQILLPALLLLAGGIAVLTVLDRRERAREEARLRERAENLAADFADALREGLSAAAAPSAAAPHAESAAQDAGRAALSAWTPPGEAAAHACGRFIWAPRKGVVWSEALDDALRQSLAARTRWNEWTSPGHRSARRGLMPGAPGSRAAFVLWARLGAAAYGVAFDASPVVSGGRFPVWRAGGVLFAAILLLLCRGAWWFVREAERERRENREKTTFVSHVSHELRTPLAGIALWVDLLRGGRLTAPERQRHALDVIAAENERMMRLVNNLLDLSRLDRKVRTYKLADVDLAATATAVADLLRGEFPEGGLTVRPGEAVRAHADADAVKQILVNVLGNAARYAAAQGPVEVFVCTEGAHARIAVADHGPGLTPEQRAHVFERFYRADTAGTASGGGLGLGLPISRELARDMGGDLAVAENKGGGCLFTLTLPLEKV